MKYVRPQTINDIQAKEMDHLLDDPVQLFRAKTGIELVHRTSSFNELYRIWENWNLMTDEMKKKSDEKSKELFKLTNEEHYNILLNETRIKDENEKLNCFYEFAFKRYKECMSKDLTHYHTIKHVSDMLSMYDKRKNEFNLSRYDELILKIAICYHDIVYIPGNSDNEEKSCEFMRRDLAELGAKNSLINLVSDVIMATKIDFSFRFSSNLFKVIHTLDWSGFCDYDEFKNNYVKIAKESFDYNGKRPEDNILKFYKLIINNIDSGFIVDWFDIKRNENARENIIRLLKENNKF